jgi:hypothetical protein|tara:strand:- start:758 stop:958 length:201 start_codon:yes stop_codon:yes gene_type:complete
MFDSITGKNEQSEKLTERVEDTEKVDYILEKSKLSEKELLAEILYRLENIYDVLYSDSTKPRIPRK